MKIVQQRLSTASLLQLWQLLIIVQFIIGIVQQTKVVSATTMSSSEMQNMLMRPGERVSSMNRTDAICKAQGVLSMDLRQQEEPPPVTSTVVDFYYAFISTSVINTTQVTGRRTVNVFEETLFQTIQDAVLWCFYDELDDVVDPMIVGRSSANGDDRKQRQRRQQRRVVAEEDPKSIITTTSASSSNDVSQQQQQQPRRRQLQSLSIRDARRLSIVSYSTSPADVERSDIPCNFPYDENNYCVVMHGMVTLIHHVTSNMSLAMASIWDATQTTMTHSEDMLLANNDEPALADIVSIEWLGETEEDAINGGPNGNGDGNIETDERASQTGMPIAYAVSVPLLILLAFALLLARSRARREVLTPHQMLAIEGSETVTRTGLMICDEQPMVYSGTGDPPRSFHEGMYHYTCHGARYLSTNCPDCAETKRSGFFTAGDLETINEEGQSQYERSFDDVSLAETSTSGYSGGANSQGDGASGQWPNAKMLSTHREEGEEEEDDNNADGFGSSQWQNANAIRSRQLKNGEEEDGEADGFGPSQWQNANTIRGTQMTGGKYAEDEEEENPSDHRKQNLVEPSSGNLGKKHSSIDVHQCNSATCSICTYQPRNVAFIGQDTCVVTNTYSLEEAEEEV